MFFKRKKPKALDIVGLGVKALPVLDSQVLQYVQPGENGECELVIGLDFGTSSSKVVIQAPDLPGCPGYAVDFGRLSGNSIPNLLPTKLWVSLSDGQCMLEPCEDYVMVNNIKLELFSKNMNSNFGPTVQQLPPEEIAVCYLGLLLRFSRQWFLKNKLELIRHFSVLRWSVNMGVPSPCIQDNNENKTFRRVGQAAWRLSLIAENQITLDEASGVLNYVDQINCWETDEEFTCDFEIIPEIAAGAVGYALSDLRREGLHVMVDIGASTVDVCSFLLHEQGGNDHYSLLISDVQQLGSIRLFSDRILTMKNVYEKQIKKLLDKHDPILPIDEDIKTYLVSHDRFITAFESAIRELKGQFLHMVRRVIWQTKLRRAPNIPLWREGRLPILLIGGGSKLEFFRSAVEELHDWLKYHTRNDGIIVLSVPIPDSLTESIKKVEDYQLFAVTWGLSHRSMDIGEIVPADEIPDVKPPPPPENWRKRYVSKEMV